MNISSGYMETVAGNGNAGYSGDGLFANDAELGSPLGVAVDASGNIFIADTANNRVREVNAATETISTCAGTGPTTLLGDGGSAIQAELSGPSAIALTPSGNILIADSHNNAIREVVISTGVITTIAGDGTAGYDGDGGPASLAELNDPMGVATDSSGNIFIADSGNNVIREVSAATGEITTIAGGGTNFSSFGNGEPAVDAVLLGPEGLVVSSGDLYVADTGDSQIRKIDLADGVITDVAGFGHSEYSGDGGPALSAMLNNPTGFAVDSSGNVYIADTANHRVREVVAATGKIETIAGNGTAGYSGDGGPATAAELGAPQSAYLDSQGNLLIADAIDNLARQIDLATDVITTVAGNGSSGYSGNGGPPAAAELNQPTCALPTGPGTLLIADSGNNVIRSVSAGANAEGVNVKKSGAVITRAVLNAGSI